THSESVRLVAAHQQRPCSRGWQSAGRRLHCIMIQYRVRGISNLVTASQCFLSLVLFWLWIALYQAFVPSSEGINLEYYAGYSFLIVVGLWLESVFRNRPSVSFHPRSLSIIGQIPRA